MESSEDRSVSSPTVAVSSSPEILSPGGKSRYGRSRRPKISRDFYNTDQVVIEEKPGQRPSPSRLNQSPKSPVGRELVFEMNSEFTKLNDLEMKVANNFKVNLQRGLDDTIKERKFFKSMLENKTENNVVDVTKVLKLITTKPAVVELCETKTTPKSILKTYSNRRKPPHDNDCFIVESFGLPDEPIIPIKSPTRIERNNKIDVGMNCENDVNLINPWGFEELDPVPLYASEPVLTKDETHYSRGGVLDLLSYNELMSDKVEVDKVFDCQDDTNFEKSRIPALGVPNSKTQRQAQKVIPKKFQELEHTKLNQSKSQANLQEEKSKLKRLNKSPKKKSVGDHSSRILRSKVDNNNEVKTDTLPSTSQTRVINPVKVSRDICKSQVRVILNPLSCARESQEQPNLVRNPFKIKSQKERISPKIKTFSVTEALLGPYSKALKRSDKKSPQKNVEIKEEIDIKDIKLEPIDFQVGDLVWAKIGTHPYWPCMVTEEPLTQIHKKFVVNRTQPVYHVRFFGDRGRRSWVTQQYLILYYGRDDLDRLAKALTAENKVKASYIKESYIVKPPKLVKWQFGVNEAESLKYRSVQERLDYFFDTYDCKRAKKEPLDELKVKKEVLDDFPEGVGKKRTRLSEDLGLFTKKIKIDEVVIKEEVPEVVEVDTKDSDEVQQENKPISTRINPQERRKLPRRLCNGSSRDNSTEEPVTPSRKKFKQDEEVRTILIEGTPPEKRTRSNKKEDSSLHTVTIDLTEEHPKIRKKFIREEEFSNEALEARKKLRSSRNESIEIVHETNKDVDVPKITKRDSTEENFLQEQEEKESKVLNKRHQIPGEYSNSDTDSKFSDNSSVPVSLKSQAAMYRRNNIFRGIPKEKVCQVCEQGGEIFKCKGSCNGVYHYTCAQSLVKTEESIEVKDTEDEIIDLDKGSEQTNVEIISVGSKKPLPNLGDSPNYKGMTLAEKIDLRMKEIMKKFDYQSVYAESTDSSSEELLLDESFEKLQSPSKLSLTVTQKPTKKEVPIIKHVTADNISYICVTNEKPKDENIAEQIEDGLKNLKCARCSTGETPNCLVCNKEESPTGSKFRQKCSLHQCGKYYHPECLKAWPQTQWSLIQRTKDKQSDAQYDTFVCPSHVCHTCISDDPHTANSRVTSDKVVKCLRCPATYHSSNFCVPAATDILSSSQIICPRHFYKDKSRKRMQQTINTNWCFICSKGGNLICCETCPTSVHIECLPGDLNKDDTFFCEDCQSGRLPLYDEIVWVKLGTYRWWPAVILFPNEIPENVRNIAHNKGEFVVKFFGTYNHYWVSRGRTFLFQEGDKGHSNSSRNRVDNAFAKAIGEAAAAHELKKQFKLTMVAEKKNDLKPPPYIRIKVNKPVGNVRLFFDGNTSNTTSCDCDPNQPHPCGPDSDCLNRLLLTECNPDVCPAGERCNNQRFEKREYPPLVPHRTSVRGWGLKTLAPIRKGQFVIEYVGELIDEQEYQRRIQKMHEQKEENYYFLTIDKDRMLDAGPKGNVARFMNHSCQPNCETQKWTVNGDTRVGLFANCDIPADTELTFNYNLECIGKEKKMCKCGAPNCSGFIGVKVKPDAPPKKSTKPPKKKKVTTTDVIIIEDPCFICGKMGDVGACNNKMCTKYYHLGCVNLESWPDGGKWVCSWHNCNICSKRTFRCCVKCVNSYCPSHSQGNVRYDKSLGFVCSDHDPMKETIEVPKTDELDSTNLSMRLNGWKTSTPLTTPKDENSASVEKNKAKRVKKRGKRRL